MCNRFWRELREKNFIGLGYHGGKSYLSSSFWPYYLDWKVFRYDRKKDKKPILRLIEFLREFPSSILVIGTDSGKPYFKVRKSLVEMAVSLDRPVVAVRLSASLSCVLGNHSFPLPFATVASITSRVITAAELRAIGIDLGVELIQGEMDTLSRRLLNP